jgi:hypothetical protein
VADSGLMNKKNTALLESGSDINRLLEENYYPAFDG